MGTDYKTTIPTDTTTGGVETITTEHHEVHEGGAYVIAHSGTKNSSEEINIVFTTPALATAGIHLTVAASGSGVSTLAIREGAVSSGGSAATARNRNRNSANTSTLTSPVTDATVSSSGTVLFSLGIGAGQKESGEHRGDEFLLKASTKYALQLTSGAASNALRLVANWYEED